MKRLLTAKPETVRSLTSLQTAFSREKITYMCLKGSRDLTTVAAFIGAIDALEELRIVNHEPDVHILWPGIYAYAQSLQTLAIHTPPGAGQHAVWTAAAVREAAERLPQLDEAGGGRAPRRSQRAHPSGRQTQKGQQAGRDPRVRKPGTGGSSAPTRR
jgi:hypothetical protein